jgi:hypothetical protein
LSVPSTFLVEVAGAFCANAVPAIIVMTAAMAVARRNFMVASPEIEFTADATSVKSRRRSTGIFCGPHGNKRERLIIVDRRAAKALSCLPKHTGRRRMRRAHAFRRAKKAVGTLRGGRGRLIQHFRLVSRTRCNAPPQEA